MKKYFKIGITILICFLIFTEAGYSENITGSTGSSSKWGSGWLDLDRMSDFEAGGKLILRVGGSAKKILVRLLKKGADPNDTTGIIGGIVVVPKNRLIEIILERSYKKIVQISVHGGTNPWGKFRLGGGNGPATIIDINYINPSHIK